MNIFLLCKYTFFRNKTNDYMGILKKRLYLPHKNINKLGI